MKNNKTGIPNRIPNGKLLSIVVPLFNESLGFEALINDLSHVALSVYATGMGVEIVLVDNDSTDNTWEKMNSLYEDNSNPFFVTIVRHIRNRGMQASLASGIAKSHGDLIAVIQADLQDPPEMIFEMVLHWLDGADFVATRISKRNSSLGNRIFSWLFYRILRSVSSEKTINDSSDFYLMDKVLASKLLNSLSANPFLRTTLSELQKPDIVLDYERRDRSDGTSKFNLSRKISFALDGILRDLGSLVKVVSFFAVVLGLISLIGLFALVVSYLSGYRSPVSGWISMVTLQLLAIALVSLIGAISTEFLNRIYREIPYKGLDYVAEAKSTFII
jgi:glycosyltransferase involved in cell wall biosynthesis